MTGDVVFTYFLIAAAVLLVGAAAWHQVRTWRTPGRRISQNAPLDDARIVEAMSHHDRLFNGQISGGGGG